MVAVMFYVFEVRPGHSLSGMYTGNGEMCSTNECLVHCQSARALWSSGSLQEARYRGWLC